ncbi:MAG: response regulator [Rhodocyclales bacterium RIFCSPLOWO2_02_FULL_63_24]|nr:MAG: response regulator [Rhodocyclales bacterium GWA2_65_19]OHC72738.1 MAG: response regulator [Rhodocyclales bacterium RIFCSPLOWO2_02_FULL_63_24]
MADVLTSSEAARLCGVSFRTVIRWIERGQLQGYRLPGRGDYRVPVAELRRFMQANAIPEPPELQRDLPRRILIVEDEPDMARAMSRVLKRAGFETASAGDGFQAGLMLHSYQPGLMTLDLRMPGVDGFAVLRSLREKPLPFSCKVLVVSADTARLDQARALGADGVLAKPFANAELLSAVRSLYGVE